MSELIGRWCDRRGRWHRVEAIAVITVGLQHQALARLQEHSVNAAAHRDPLRARLQEGPELDPSIPNEPSHR